MERLKKLWPVCGLLICSTLGISLLSLVYLLPVQLIQQHVEQSIELYKEQGEYPLFLSWDYSTRKDNFTDMLMLEKAAYNETKNPFGAALLIPSPRYTAHPETIDRHEQVINSEPGDLPQNTCARYWHGYLVILKPL